MPTFSSDPKSKADVVDRLLSQTFTGDLRDLAAEPKKVKVRRVKPHVVALEIGSKEYLLTVHRPRPEEVREKLRQKYHERMSRGKGGAGKRSHANHNEAPKEAPRGLGRYGG